MKTYDVQFIHVIEREVTYVVEANSEEEALEKAKNAEYIDSDEDNCPEQSIETINYVVLGESEYIK